MAALSRTVRETTSSDATSATVRPSANGEVPVLEVANSWEEVFRGKAKQALPDL